MIRFYSRNELENVEKAKQFSCQKAELLILWPTFRLKKKKGKKIVQAKQFCFGNRREQISSTSAVKTEALRGQKHPRDYGFYLWTAASSCIALESKVKHISLKASGLQQWSRTEKKLTLARQQTLLKAETTFSLY